MRAGAHEDINLITLLVGASAEGLEVRSHAGEWVPFTADADTIVVNIGDMLQRLTNHVYPSTTHRVVNPPGENARKPRYSVPFFLHPNPDFVIDVLPSCVDAAHPSRYPQPITAHDYLQERLREIKLDLAGRGHVLLASPACGRAGRRAMALRSPQTHSRTQAFP